MSRAAGIFGLGLVMHTTRGAATLRQMVRSVFMSTLLLSAVCRVGWADPLTLTPSVSVSEQYNDNVFFDDQGAEDFVTSIHEGLSLSYQRPRLSLSLSTGNSSQLYARQTQENSATGAQYGTLTAASQPSERLSLTLSDSMARVDRTRNGSAPGSSSELPAAEQPSPDAQASVLLSRGSALTNSFGSSASYLLAPRWTAGLTYNNSLSDFSDPGGSDITNRFGLSLGYAWRPTTSISVFYSYSRFDTQNFPHTQSHNPALGFSHRFDPTWSVSASTGIYVRSPLTSGRGVSTTVGPTFSASVTKLFERASLVGGAAQQITGSGGVAGASTTLSAFLGYQAQLLEKVSGSLYASYGHFDTDQTTYEFVTGTAVLSMPFWRYFRGGLSYSYRWRDNTQATANTTAGVVDGNLVQLYVSASYPVWRGEM